MLYQQNALYSSKKRLDFFAFKYILSCYRQVSSNQYYLLGIFFVQKKLKPIRELLKTD